MTNAAVPGSAGPARSGFALSSPAHWPRWLRMAAALAVVLAVGSVDYLTGHEILLSTFYLGAVALAAWTIGPGFAILISLLSVGAWLIGDLAAGATYPHAFVPVWNAAIILVFYLVVIALLGRLRAVQRDLEVRVKQRTVALTEEMAERERLERELLDISERERRRIGRDLHDTLGQLLTGTALAGQVLHEKLAARSVEGAEESARIVTQVEEAIQLTRSLARGLDPVEIEAGGLAQGLRELAAATNQLQAGRCEYQGEEITMLLDNTTATHIYRIAQEAVTNAVRHGRAGHISIRIDEFGDRIRLTVNDDGVGIAAPDRRPSGMGLRIMAHRATVIGGTFQVTAQPGGGTTVTCEVPEP